MQEGSRRAIIAAFLANLGIAIAKFLGFLVTGASSMLAESIHSVADTSNQGLLFLGGIRARRAPSPEHPFGYGAVRYFWSFIVALVLFSVGGLFAIWEGIEKLRHPDEIDNPIVAFVILGFGIVLEGFSFWTAIKESRKVKGKLTYWQFVRRSKSPELPVVLLEDLGAQLGLMFAMFGVAMAVITDQPRWDGAATLAIGLLLVVIAVVLTIEMKSLLIGESASQVDITAITEAIQTSPEVDRLINLRTLHLGPDELLVAAEIHFTSGLSTTEVATAIDATEARIRAAVHTSLVIYLEPDLYEEGAPPPEPAPDH